MCVVPAFIPRRLEKAQAEGLAADIAMMASGTDGLLLFEQDLAKMDQGAQKELDDSAAQFGVAPAGLVVEDLGSQLFAVQLAQLETFVEGWLLRTNKTRTCSELRAASMSLFKGDVTRHGGNKV